MSSIAQDGARSSTSARDLAFIAVFAGVTAAFAFVPSIQVPGVPAPITAQTLGVLLAGLVLGGRRGFASQLLFIVLVALGLPLLSGFKGGLGVFASPSAGFLVGWPFCAGVIGWLAARGAGRYSLVKGLVATVLGGIVLMYAFGIIGFVLRAHLPLGKAILLNATYIPGDLVKCVLAAVVARGVHQAYPGLLRSHR